MTDGNVEVEKHQIDELVSKVKADISRNKGKVILGVFNDKIPVILRHEGERPLIHELFNEREYRIHFEDINGVWWIQLNNSSARFAFYIPEELKKIIASNPISNVLDVKQRHMSTLTITYRFNGNAITVKLFVDSEWIKKLIV
ncbi:hypothetical protein [Bdellovibrio svalbardensis]|uniref:Uncharacterized protein n=1 Tax=Bdellovibrio svalbardensis TaxID=2972972 RepID=A0ABT6DE82_9BACT|nr:hypothetical protein [Bdellovibrio svalbardensis]MDG0815136.1 hypothetical protein [Bdellovibrio svalbardensis]